MFRVSSKARALVLGLMLTSAGVGAAALLAGASDAVSRTAPGVATPGEVVSLRRLTESQYRQSIADIFSPDIKISGRFEPEVRRDGLIAVGNSEASVSASGMEQYYAMAGAIAEQALSAERRGKTVPCPPQSATAPDDVCAATFVKHYGRLLHRRALTDPEVAARVSLAHRVSAESNDFYAGLQEALISLLTAPDFLFRIERAEGPIKKGVAELDAYSRASRLSFLFWNSAPDDELLKAAEGGALATKPGLQAQVDRLAGSPRMAEGVGAFFDDMLQLSMFNHQSKDPQFFPKYSQTLMVEAREQTVRTLVDLLVAKNGDYRDIFTSRDTFMTRTLAMVYKVPYTARSQWSAYTFPENSGRSGVLTEISFLSLFSHPARSSPTKRGVALNEIFLCEPTPSPPGNVDFSIVNGSAGGPPIKTVRARLMAHATDETCASCHTSIDPPGLTLERFDSLGQMREFEDGEKIDVRAEVDGHQIEGADGLGYLLRENPRVPACVVKNLYATATGRAVEPATKPVVAELTKAFVAGDYRVPAFLKAMATNDALYSVRIVGDGKPVAPTKVAALGRARATPAKEATP